MNFVKSVAEGNSAHAKKLFIDEAVLFGYLDGKLEHGSIEQFYHNVDTVPGGDNFKARVDVLMVEESLAVVRVLEEGWGNRIDFTDVFVRMKEILYVKVRKCTPEDKVELFQIAETFKAKVIDYWKDSLLLEFVQTATKNDAVIKLMKEEFRTIEVVRGGSVGIESISMMER